MFNYCAFLSSSFYINFMLYIRNLHDIVHDVYHKKNVGFIKEEVESSVGLSCESLAYRVMVDR